MGNGAKHFYALKLGYIIFYLKNPLQHVGYVPALWRFIV